MTYGSGSSRSSSRFIVVAICSATIIVDGYDTIVYGTVVPTLVGGGAEWKISAGQAGRIGAYALFGMLVGALVSGTLTDLIGRRRTMLGSIAWFSAAMVLAAAAPTPELFGAARFVAGIGLGGVVPTAIALTIEYAHPRRRSATNAVMFSGYSIGGIIVSLTAIWVIPAIGWRPMFAIGAVLGVLLLPLAWRLLPESAEYLLARGRADEAHALAARFGLQLSRALDTAGSSRVGGVRALGQLVKPGLLLGTLMFWLATGMGLLLVYALNTWLAQIMRTAGYGLSSALAFMLVLNLGAIIGTPLLGTVADRVGSKPTTALMFLVASVCIFSLSFRLPTGALYLLVAIAGACSIGTTILVNAFTASYYPTRLRATGLGWALGVGRVGAILGPLYGAYIQESGWGIKGSFYAFAVPGLIGALAMLLVPQRAATIAVAQPEGAPAG